MAAPSSYQVGIMMAIGSQLGDRFAVRSNDRYFCEAVQPVFGTSIITLEAHGAPQYCIKSAKVSRPTLEDVTSPADFIRAWSELKGGVNPITQHRHDGRKYHVVGFKVYGPEYIMHYIQANAPIAPKQLAKVKNSLSGGYIGETMELKLQKADTEQFLDYITGFPYNPAVWDMWGERMKRIRDMDKKEDK